MATRTRAAKSAKPAERYTHGYAVASEVQADRNIGNSAFFLLPHLKRGMSVIDCGSGTGTIAVSLAGVVAPGKVEGIELNSEQARKATANALSAGVRNVRFQQGSVYELPFADNTFDAALAHTVLQHLADPVKALREMHRVLKPGGVVGVREEDWDAWIRYPDHPIVNEAMRIYRAVWERNGGHPAGAKMHRRWLREAGFARSEAGAGAYFWPAKEIIELSPGLILDPQYVEAAARYGLADRAKLESHVAAIQKLAADPDFFCAVLMCHAIGWKA